MLQPGQELLQIVGRNSYLLPLQRYQIHSLLQALLQVLRGVSRRGKRANGWEKLPGVQLQGLATDLRYGRRAGSVWGSGSREGCWEQLTNSLQVRNTRQDL